MDTIAARETIQNALSTGRNAIGTVHCISQQLGNVPRNKVSPEDIGTLFVQIIKNTLLPACGAGGGTAPAAHLTAHCADFINNFWDLVRDDPEVMRRAVWDVLVPAMPYFVRALDIVARRTLSSEAGMLQPAVVDNALELLNNLIRFDDTAMGNMEPKDLQVIWKRYLFPPVIKGEPSDREASRLF